MSKVGRDPGAKGGGNARKRTRLVVAIDDNWTAVQLADAIASGNVPVRTRPMDDRDTAGCSTHQENCKAQKASF